jgi:hypothetical protein
MNDELITPARAHRIADAVKHRPDGTSQALAVLSKEARYLEAKLSILTAYDEGELGEALRQSHDGGKCRRHPETKEPYRCALCALDVLAAAYRSVKAKLAEAEKSWRCFHCGEVFTDEESARSHFAIDGIPPMCVDPLTKDEKARMVMVRRLEAELVKWRKENEDLDHMAGCFKAMESELTRYFGTCGGFPVKTASQAWLVHEAMIGRAEAAESRAEQAEAALAEAWSVAEEQRKGADAAEKRALELSNALAAERERAGKMSEAMEEARGTIDNGARQHDCLGFDCAQCGASGASGILQHAIESAAPPTTSAEKPCQCGSPILRWVHHQPPRECGKVYPPESAVTKAQEGA